MLEDLCYTFIVIFLDYFLYELYLINFSTFNSNNFDVVMSTFDPKQCFCVDVMCVQDSLTHFSMMENKGLKLSPYILEHIQLYWEGDLEENLNKILGISNQWR